MLMYAHDVNVVLSGHFDQFIDVVFVYTEFALRAASNHVAGFTRPNFRIHPDKNILPF
jgi:hypothetical protein